MTDADRISQFANVPHDLAELVVMGANRIGSSLKWFRSDRRFEELVAGRAWVAREARQRGHSFPAIGRALNRDHSSIIHLVRTRG
jgi:chromosomal replication initiation ATPase DnaA